MKKILSFLVLAIALVSCNKPLDYINQGNVLAFRYSPSDLRAALISPTGLTARVRISDGREFTIRCVTSTQQGDCFILEAPFVPENWDWDYNNNTYKASGGTWNSAYGFGPSICNAYWVENGQLHKGGAAWDRQPSMYGWVSSFNAINTSSGIFGKTTFGFPVMGTIAMSLQGNQRLVALP